MDGNRLSDGLQIKRTGWSPHQLTAYLFHPEIQSFIGEGRNIPQPCVSRIVSENLFHCPLKNRKRHNAQSIICWFQAALIAALSDAASLPRCFVNNDFSTVTSRLSRATDGFSRPASVQPRSSTSGRPEYETEVIRQIKTSIPKSKRTKTGRGLLKVPEVNGKRQT